MRLNSGQLMAVNVRNIDEKKVWKSVGNIFFIAQYLLAETTFVDKTRFKAMLWVVMFCRKALVT